VRAEEGSHGSVQPELTADCPQAGAVLVGASIPDTVALVTYGDPAEALGASIFNSRPSGSSKEIFEKSGLASAKSDVPGVIG
jgi:hypothetical protein